METELLQWQHKDYFDYSIYEEDEVGRDIWYWHRQQYYEFQCMYSQYYQFVALDFHGRILTVHYMEYQDEIFLPAAGTKKFSTLEAIPVEYLPVARATEVVYELKGRIKEGFKQLIAMQPPQTKPILNNEYDFRKQIGTNIWKNGE